MLMAFGMVATACGGDSASDGESSEPTAVSTDAAADTTTAEASDTTAAESTDEANAPSGDPIKVMVTGTIESQVFSFPSAPLGAQIAIDEVNAAGGVNGRPLELVECNDEFDPNKATACIQTAAQEGVVAIVGGISVFEPAIVPLMEASGIAWVGATPAVVLDSPIQFPIDDGATQFAGIGAAAALQGCETPAVIISAQGTPSNNAAIKAGVESNGATVSAELQANGPDFAPLVESALADGADCFAAGVSPAEIGGLLAAVQGRVPVTTVDGTLPTQLLGALGGAADGMHVVTGFLLPESGDADVLALQATSLAVAPNVSMDNFWFTGYVGVKLVAEALDGVDAPTAEAVLNNMSTISGFDTGVGPVLDYTTPNPVAAYSRVFNSKVFLWEIDGGAYSLLTDEPIDLQPALELMG